MSSYLNRFDKQKLFDKQEFTKALQKSKQVPFTVSRKETSQTPSKQEVIANLRLKEREEQEKLRQLLQMQRRAFRLARRMKHQDVVFAQENYKNPQAINQLLTQQTAPGAIDKQLGSTRVELQVKLMLTLLIITLLAANLLGCTPPSNNETQIQPTVIAQVEVPAPSPTASPQAEAIAAPEPPVDPTDTAPLEPITSNGNNPPVEEVAAPSPESTQLSEAAIEAAILQSSGETVDLVTGSIEAVTEKVSVVIHNGIAYIATVTPEGSIVVKSTTADEYVFDSETKQITFKTSGVPTATFDTEQANKTGVEPIVTPILMNIDLSELTPESPLIQLSNVHGGPELFEMTKSVYPSLFAESERNIGEVKAEIVLGGAGAERSTYEIPSANLVVYSIDNIVIGVFRPETNEVLPAVGGREINFGGVVQELPFPVLLINEQSMRDNNATYALTPKEGESLGDTQKRYVLGILAFLAYQSHSINDLPNVPGLNLNSNVALNTLSDKKREDITNYFVQDLLNKISSSATNRTELMNGIYFDNLSTLNVIAIRCGISNERDPKSSQPFGHNQTGFSILFERPKTNLFDTDFSLLGGPLSFSLRIAAEPPWNEGSFNNLVTPLNGTSGLTDQFVSLFAGMSVTNIRNLMLATNPGSQTANPGLPWATNAGSPVENPLSIGYHLDPVGLIPIESP